MDYVDQGNLRRAAMLSPEEQAASDALERSDANRRELAAAIEAERDPNKRRILMGVQRTLDGDPQAPAGQQAAPAPGAHSLLGALQTLNGGDATGARGMTLFEALQRVPEAVPAPPPSSTLRRVVGDTAVSALKGAVSVPESVVGLADMVTGGEAGRVLENKDGSFGFRPKEAQSYLDTLYSPEQQQANQAVQQADGVVDTLKAAAQHPSVIFHSAVQSLPMMIEGGITGRALMAGAERAAPRIAARMAGETRDMIAGAVGEGVTGAGSAAEQIRQETPGGRMTAQQVGWAGVSGAADTGFALLGGRVAKALGIHDVDTLLAGKASPEITKGFLRRVLEGAVSEGLLEELPQNIAEQVSQNMALGKPIGEGVAQQAVLGALTGMAMGGGSNVLAGGHKTHADAIRDQKVGDPQGPLSRAVNDGIEAQAKAVEVQQGLDESAAAVQAALPAPTEPLAVMPAEPGASDAQIPAEPQTQPADLEASLQRMHEQAAKDAQSLRDFTPAPAAPREPATVTVASDDANPQPLDGDVQHPNGHPFRNRQAAVRKQRELGDGFVVASVNGGYVVRPTPANASIAEVGGPEPAVTQAPAQASPAQPAESVIDENAHQSAESPHNDLPNPSAAQAEAGNYQLGHDNETFPGLDLSIENPAGSKRYDKKNVPPKWETLMQHHYGYVKGTVGADGDHVDVFVKPGTPKGHTGPVYIVDQQNKDGSLDEHKVMMGFDSEQEARDAYLSNYEKGWKGLQAITPMPFDDFKAWVRDPEKTKLAAAPMQESAPSAPAIEATQEAPAVAQTADEGSAASAGAPERTAAAERPSAAEAAGVELGAIEQRISEAEGRGVVLSAADKDRVRQLLQEAHDLRRKAERTSAAGADPMNKGNSFPMGVGFTRETKRSNQRIDASVRRAGEAVKFWEAAKVKEQGAERMLQGVDTDAHKAKQAERKAETQRALVRKLVNHQPGDKIGPFTIERVNKDRDGYPATYTISGDGIVKGVQDKVDVAREFFGSDKAAFRAMVDAERATEPATAPKETAMERRKRLAAEKQNTKTPAPAAPESAAATTGEGHEGQEGQGRRQEVLTPEAPAAVPEVPAPAPAPEPARERRKRLEAERQAPAAEPSPAPAPEPAAPPARAPSREEIELRKRASILQSLKACLAS